MPFERILVAIDGSDCSNRAYAKAIELDHLLGSTADRVSEHAPSPVMTVR